jgi:transaldolase
VLASVRLASEAETGGDQVVNRAVFLDRDGVINDAVVRGGSPLPPASPADFRILPGVPEACQSLKDAGYLLVVATNQPDVGRGTQTESAVRQMHETMSAELPIDRVEVCYDSAGGRRRKPEPGMLIDAARALNIDLQQSFMVGDRWRDIDCGNAAGCTTVLIDRGYIDRGYEERLHTQPKLRSRDLADAARQIKIYADGADRDSMLALNADPLIAGLTTNPTLMHKAGVRHFEAFARDILQIVRSKPVSFEVFADEFPEMRRQAVKIAGWGSNVYVKIPVTNTRGEASYGLIQDLTSDGVKVNVTAILTLDQVQQVAESLAQKVPAVVSVFAGRVADTGMDPAPMMRSAKDMLSGLPGAELLWASVREVLNIFQAGAAGCDIVTVPHDILKKAKVSAGMDLTALSLDTVRMFARDAAAAGFRL